MPQLEHRWMIERRHSKVCKGCGNPFNCARDDAVCCGPSCRQRYRRKLLAAGQVVTEAAEAVAITVPTRAEVKRPKRKPLTRTASSSRTTPRSKAKKKGGKKR